jgi:hypothetical protein
LFFGQLFALLPKLFSCFHWFAFAKHFPKNIPMSS